MIPVHRKDSLNELNLFDVLSTKQLARPTMNHLQRPYRAATDHRDLVLLTELCVGGGGREKSKSVSGNMSLSLEWLPSSSDSFS